MKIIVLKFGGTSVGTTDRIKKVAKIIAKYKKKYKLSIKENDKFWAKEGKRITWIKKYSKIKDIKYRD